MLSKLVKNTATVQKNSKYSLITLLFRSHHEQYNENYGQ
jgi:hypothetical protein